MTEIIGIIETNMNNYPIEWIVSLIIINLTFLFRYYSHSKTRLIFDFNVSTCIMNIFFIFFAPISEESMFRYSFKHVLEYYNFNNIIIITSVLFSLAHISNCFVVSDIMPCIWQMFTTFILGMILFSAHDVVKSLIYHCTYNFVISFITYLFLYIKNKKGNLLFSPSISIKNRTNSCKNLNKKNKFDKLFDYKTITSENAVKLYTDLNKKLTCKLRHFKQFP